MEDFKEIIENIIAIIIGYLFLLVELRFINQLNIDSTTFLFTIIIFATTILTSIFSYKLGKIVEIKIIQSAVTKIAEAFDDEDGID